jgi:hypothetical protein
MLNRAMRFFVLLFLTVSLSGRAVAGFDFSCYHHLMLAAMEDELKIREAEIRRDPHLLPQIQYQGRTFDVGRIYASGGEARLIGQVLTPEGPRVLKQFYDLRDYFAYVGRMRQLRQAGFPALEVLGQDDETLTVMLYDRKLIDAMWIMRSDLALHRQMVAARNLLADDLDTRARDLGILVRPVQPGNVLYDVELGAFVLVDPT